MKLFFMLSLSSLLVCSSSLWAKETAHDCNNCPCASEKEKFCETVTTHAEVLSCLEKNKEQLSEVCKQHLASESKHQHHQKQHKKCKGKCPLKEEKAQAK